jgi:regulator of sirC expression with transglutaminase-like and TPR domain
MINEKKDDENYHSFLLRIEKDLWDEFLKEIPMSMTATDKIKEFIRTFVNEQRFFKNEDDDNAKKR